MTKGSRKSITQNKIKELETRIKELTAGWQRTQADFENYRKRIEKLKNEWLSSANADLILRLLPVLDNFQRSIKHLPKELENNEWVKGIQCIEKQLSSILSQTGLVKIHTKPGDDFDHNIHEAISYEQNDQFKENQIIDIIEDGYKLGERVLRPAKVRVSKGQNSGS